MRESQAADGGRIIVYRPYVDGLAVYGHSVTLQLNQKGDLSHITGGFDKPNPTNAKKLVKDVGRVQVISGRTNQVLHEIIGEKAKDHYGTVLLGNVDLNKNGFMDVIIGAPLADSEGIKDNGAAIIVYGGPVAITDRINGLRSKALFGSSLAVSGEFLAIGAPKDTVIESTVKMAGAVHLYDLDDLQAVPLVSYSGNQPKAMFGSGIAFADVNGDGLSELVIGAAKMDDMRGTKKNC